MIGIASALHPSFTTDAAISATRITQSPAWLGAHLLLLVGVVAFDVSLLSWPARPGRLGGLGVMLNLATYPVFLGIDGFAAWIAAHSGSGATTAVVVQALFASPLAASFGWIGAAGWVIAALSFMAESISQRRGLISAPLPLLIGVVWLGVSHAPPIGIVGAAFATAGCLWEGLREVSDR